MDKTEPASFYVPGIDDWRLLKSARGQAGFAARSLAEKELIFPVNPEELDEQ